MDILILEKLVNTLKVIVSLVISLDLILFIVLVNNKLLKLNR